MSAGYGSYDTPMPGLLLISHISSESKSHFTFQVYQWILTIFPPILACVFETEFYVTRMHVRREHINAFLQQEHQRFYQYNREENNQ